MDGTVQVNVKLDRELNEWLEKEAGGSRERADFLRKLLVEERRRRQAQALREVFDQAAHDLSREDRLERDDLLEAYTRREP